MSEKAPVTSTENVREFSQVAALAKEADAKATDAGIIGGGLYDSRDTGPRSKHYRAVETNEFSADSYSKTRIDVDRGADRVVVNMTEGSNDGSEYFNADSFANRETGVVSTKLVRRRPGAETKVRRSDNPLVHNMLASIALKDVRAATDARLLKAQTHAEERKAA